MKRLWNELPLETQESWCHNFDDTKLALARRFLDDAKFAEKINMDDCGSLIGDYKLLLKLRATEMELKEMELEKTVEMERSLGW